MWKLTVNGKKIGEADSKREIKNKVRRMSYVLLGVGMKRVEE